MGEGKAARGVSNSVYFIQGEATGLIKIGFARDPIARLRELQCGSPDKLRLLRTIPGGYALERELHLRFAALRSHCEWFRVGNDLAAFLQAPIYREALPPQVDPGLASRFHRPLPEREQHLVDVLAASFPRWERARSLARQIPAQTSEAIAATARRLARQWGLVEIRMMRDDWTNAYRLAGGPSETA